MRVAVRDALQGGHSRHAGPRGHQIRPTHSPTRTRSRQPSWVGGRGGLYLKGGLKAVCRLIAEGFQFNKITLKSLTRPFTPPAVDAPVNLKPKCPPLVCTGFFLPECLKMSHNVPVSGIGTSGRPHRQRQHSWVRVHVKSLPFTTVTGPRGHGGNFTTAFTSVNRHALNLRRSAFLSASISAFISFLA